MKAVVTRVKSASVTIDGQVNGSIGQGFLVLLGVGPEDTPEICARLAEKIANVRVFSDEADKMNLSIGQVGGSFLVVSQFTLYADLRKRRPGFHTRPGRNWRSLSMSSLCRNCGRKAFRSSMVHSVRICRSNPSTTVRLRCSLTVRIEKRVSASGLVLIFGGWILCRLWLKL